MKKAEKAELEKLRALVARLITIAENQTSAGSLRVALREAGYPVSTPLERYCDLRSAY